MQQWLTLREDYVAQATKSRSRVGEVVPLVFANPFITVKRVERSLGVTNQGARNLIRDAEARGWVRPLEVRGRRQYWLAADIFQIIEAPPLYERRHEPESADERHDARPRDVEDS